MNAIKLLSVNTVFMMLHFNGENSITTEQFNLHKNQFEILMDMIDVPKFKYNLTAFLQKEDSFNNFKSLTNLNNKIIELAESICGISEEDMTDIYLNFYKENKNHASILYSINTAPLINNAYLSYLTMNHNLNLALEN